MSKSNKLETDFIDGIFGGVAVPLHAILYVSLHTAEPPQSGNQESAEATFTGYARQAVTVPAGWTTSNDQAENANAIDWDEATAGVETLTHFALGTDETGAGDLLYIGALSGSVSITPGVTVSIAAGALVVTED